MFVHRTAEELLWGYEVCTGVHAAGSTMAVCNDLARSEVESTSVCVCVVRRILCSAG